MNNTKSDQGDSMAQFSSPQTEKSSIFIEGRVMYI